MAGNDANTLVLLHMDGTNGSTTFTDDAAGGSGHAWTAHDSAQLDTGSKEFGTASGKFVAGTLDWIDTPSSTDFAFGTGDFTVDFWFNNDGTASGARYFYGYGDTTGSNSGIAFAGSIGGNTTNKPDFALFSGATAAVAIGSSTITDSTWHHYAGVCRSGAMTLYIDGTSVATATSPGSLNSSGSMKLAAGRLGAFNGGYLTGHIDEFRISNAARWTSNFTPPTSPYDSVAAQPYNPWPQLAPLLAQRRKAERCFSGWRRRGSGLFTPAWSF